MALLKIGNVVVNLDTVRSATWQDDTLVITYNAVERVTTFSTPAMDKTDASYAYRKGEFTGPDAEQAWKKIQEIAT